ncbi:NAD(P)-binding protein [Burkholderia sp. S171]|uniref:NAD(P)-binding protein n=1 Tax=Burkholderia sp. S171 TaxID=1641860 RepID=UPI00131C5F2B|nr:NAD(P)-binding protein [Burkholderia sp. S171]
MERPDYIYTNGSPLQRTPMHLSESEMYGFLIKGDKEKLQATVDKTLNAVAGNKAIFHVLSPYVMLTFTQVNHAQSGYEEDNERGWGKECDIIPWIMVGQMDERDGEARLQRIFLHPSYTWVDVTTAVSIGREVFGYPKSICKLEMPGADDDPDTFKIACEGWEPFSPESQLGIHPLLEIVATDKTHDHVPVSGFRKIVLEGLKLLRSEPDLLSLDIAGIKDMVSMLLEPHVDQLFLKQFPDTSGMKAVYQAVVSAPAIIDKVHHGRLLGYTYECTLHQFDSYRLDQTLGFQLGPQRVLLPFHISMDFTVNAGEELAESAESGRETIAAAPADEAAPLTAARAPQFFAAVQADERVPADRPDGREKIVILGGGPAAMTAAFYLTDEPDWRTRYDITVYQMGWRLGGKCASGRNADMGQRIEEHGLHMWFGFYNNAFDLMRKAYDALDRAPGAPLATWQDAFKPHNFIVLTEFIKGSYKFWPMQMPIKPGTPGAHNGELTVLGMTATLTAWIHQWIARLDQHLIEVIRKNLKEDIKHVENIAHDIRDSARRLKDSFHLLAHKSRDSEIGGLQVLRASVFDSVHQFLDQDDPTRHLFICIDLAITALIGMHADGIMHRNFDVVNDIEFRAWLLKHGANANYSVNSALVRALYDLAFAFAYVDGDTAAPNIEAGTMLRGILRLNIDYHGGFIWKMQAGMGDTVFTPLYQVLKQRGVKFEFFHKVEDLIPEAAGNSVSEIVITQQVALKAGLSEYDPLVAVAGLDCWPSRPNYDQIDAQQAELLKNNDVDLESHWNDWAQIHSAQFQKPLPVKRLKRGVDFDKIVFGLPVGSLKYVCPKIIDYSPALNAACQNIKTTATQAYQMWLSEELKNLGWKHFGSEGEDPILSSFSEPFDTLTPMNQLLSRETWPAGRSPQSVAYFCSPIRVPDFPPATETGFPVKWTQQVKSNALDQLKKQASNLWPSAVVGGIFKWDWLITLGKQTGEDRFDAQYWRANVNPSDLYVQSVVDSTRYRITSDQSGFNNLYFAGDWLKTGLNAGCVEGAVMGGMQASRAICGHPSYIRGETDRC